ncbi:MAG TPA: helix-turn-helix domain-containing protein, partial [Thermoanaerobaculia bacterium]|nr:helix-turn-helix domain-containing protein [Thermoanaerobaculia bacterium]
VIARKGISAATMQDIADEAGVAKGTIYLYFRDRDELVEKTFENAITELHRRIDLELDSEAAFEERLRASIRSILEFFRDHREFFRLYTAHRVPEGNPQQQRRQRRQCEFYRERMQKLAGVLGAAMAAGEIRTMDAYRLAVFISEGINSVVVERVMEEAAPPLESDVELITSVILNGICLERSTK